MTNHVVAEPNGVPLTFRQREVLEFCMQHLIDHHRPPTVVEIRDRFGWSSINAAQHHLRELRMRGYLENSSRIKLKGYQLILAKVDG